MKKYVLFLFVTIMIITVTVSAQNQYILPAPIPYPIPNSPFPYMIGPGIVGGAMMILPEHIQPKVHVYNKEQHHRFKVRSFDLYVFESRSSMPLAIVGGFCSAASAMVHGERHYIKFPGLDISTPQFQIAPSPMPCWRMDGIQP